MNEKLRNRLKSYSILAGAALASSTMKADIIYTDINPDTVLNVNGEQFILDINGDLNVDLQFRQVIAGSNYVDVAAWTGGGFATSYILTQTYGGGNAPYLWNMVSYINYGGIINDTNQFVEHGFLGWKVFGGTPYYVGKFNNVLDACVGFKLWNAGEIHYGWARIDVSLNYNSTKIKDYAYNDNADSAIACGVLPILADTGRNLVLENLNINGGASDMRINFDTASSEIGIKEYKVFIVPQTDSASINLYNLRKNSKYTSIIPNGNNISFSLTNSAKDVNGNFITGGKEYRFIVLSVPNNVNATNHQLSLFSNKIQLQTFEAHAVTNLIASDVSNLCNSSDVKVQFNKATKEEGINEYRLILVKETKASNFTLEDANLVAFPKFLGFPTGNNVNQILSSNALDSDGDIITLNVPYQFFVLSLADGISKTNTLSEASNIVTLTGCTGIENEIFNNTKIYKFENQLFINTELNNFNITILDILGNIIYRSTEKSSNQMLNMNFIDKGVYFVQIQKGNNTFSKKVIF